MIINGQDTADKVDFVYNNKCKNLNIGTVKFISQWGNNSGVNTGLLTKAVTNIDDSKLTAKVWTNIGNIDVPEQGIWLVYVEINMPDTYTGNYTLQIRNSVSEVGRQSMYSDGTIQTRLSMCVPCKLDNKIALTWFLENTGVTGATYRYRLCKLPVSPNGVF